MSQVQGNLVFMFCAYCVNKHEIQIAIKSFDNTLWVHVASLLLHRIKLVTSIVSIALPTLFFTLKFFQVLLKINVFFFQPLEQHFYLQ